MAAESHRDVVRQIRSGAVSGEEALRDIGVRRKEAAVSLIEKSEDIVTVVVLRRKSILGREAVIDGNDDGRDAAGELAADGDVGEGGVAE